MNDEPSPFRAVWVALGRLRDQLARDGTPEAIEFGRQLMDEVARAEVEWQIARRGPSQN